MEQVSRKMMPMNEKRYPKCNMTRLYVSLKRDIPSAAMAVLKQSEMVMKKY